MTEPSSRGGVQQFFGILLMVVSGLWIAFSGACGLWMVGGLLLDGGAANADIWGWGVLAFIVSGLSAAAGYAVFVVGRGLSR